MEENLQKQVEILYDSFAKPLYNLALYAIGDLAAAEQSTINAFVSAFYSVNDKLNYEQFELKSARFLYRYCRIACKKTKNAVCYSLYPLESESAHNLEKERLMQLLRVLSFIERFILLLFCQRRFSIRQMAYIIAVPKFVIIKHLNVIVNKAVKAIAT